jgi:hypothetical protein
VHDAGTVHPQPVRLVDDQQGVVLLAGGGQLDQRRLVPGPLLLIVSLELLPDVVGADADDRIGRGVVGLVAVEDGAEADWWPEITIDLEHEPSAVATAAFEAAPIFVYDVAGATVWGIGHSLLGYALGASYQRWERSITPIGIIVLVLLLLLIGGSKILAARRQVREDLEEIDAGPKHEREREREAE